MASGVVELEVQAQPRTEFSGGFVGSSCLPGRLIQGTA